jgi:hypothetical protein
MNSISKLLTGMVLAAGLIVLAIPGVAQAGNGFPFNHQFNHNHFQHFGNGPKHKFQAKKFDFHKFNGFGIQFGGFHLNQGHNFRKFDFDPHHFQHHNKKFHNFHSH